ncbi:hemerythrin domain-containing protein [Neisseria dentiae]|uniref:hemerythrin domain-containing protein n=2 Tax=Neisseria dentiae TaxID=194197 RepID=UPI0035A15872
MMSNTVFKPTHTDSKLQSGWLYLHEQMPPAKWYALPSFGSAASWLGMHHSLRRGQGELDHLNREYQNHRLEWSDYRTRLLAAAELHYGHLHGHHRVEDAHYFPKFRRLEPKLAQGFDVLDSDHAHISRLLHETEALLSQLKNRPEADPALAEKLAASVAEGGEWLYRHLADEEDLVIPVLALHGL